MRRVNSRGGSHPLASYKPPVRRFHDELVKRGYVTAFVAWRFTTWHVLGARARAILTAVLARLWTRSLEDVCMGPIGSLVQLKKEHEAWAPIVQGVTRLLWHKFLGACRGWWGVCPCANGHRSACLLAAVRRRDQAKMVGLARSLRLHIDFVVFDNAETRYVTKSGCFRLWRGREVGEVLTPQAAAALTFRPRGAGIPCRRALC